MVLFTGETVEEAIEKGLNTLEVSRIKAHIAVVAREKKGFLGFGKKLAQVEIRPIVQTEEEPEEQVQSVEVETPSEPVRSEIEPTGPRIVKGLTSVTSESTSETEKTDQSSESSSESSNVISLTDRREQQKSEEATLKSDKIKSVEAKNETPELVQVAVTHSAVSKDMEKASQEVSAYVEKIIYEMDVDATIETSHNRRNIFLQIETPEAGRVIGYHGKVLKSLQLLAQNYLHNHYSKNFTVTLNVHDYIEHRTETLIEFANKMAERVLETGRDVAMDPMSNQERKTIHKAVSRINGVTSYSEGSDPERYVVITLSE